MWSDLLRTASVVIGTNESYLGRWLNLMSLYLDSIDHADDGCRAVRKLASVHAWTKRCETQSGSRLHEMTRSLMGSWSYRAPLTTVDEDIILLGREEAIRISSNIFDLSFVLRARSRLCRRRSLKVNTFSTHFSAFLEIYKMCIQFSFALLKSH